MRFSFLLEYKNTGEMENLKDRRLEKIVHIRYDLLKRLEDLPIGVLALSLVHRQS